MLDFLMLIMHLVMAADRANYYITKGECKFSFACLKESDQTSILIIWEKM